MMVGYDPQTYQEASLYPILKTTMQEEFKSLEDNETWEMFPLPSKRKLVQCKWFYRSKVATYGSYINKNSMFFTKCFSQFQGVDYIETFTLVSKMDSIRLVLAIAASKQWEVHLWM